jgi:hypothetical protein
MVKQPEPPPELTADHIASVLDGRDDFDLELFAVRTLSGRGWIQHHGGVYNDPVLGSDDSTMSAPANDFVTRTTSVSQWNAKACRRISR